MASVTVFVDDAVRGDWPPICVRSGAPAEWTATVRVPVNRPSEAVWLLVLLGPVGWLILAILLGGGLNHEVLTVQLPYSGALEVKFRERRGRRNVAIVAAVVLTALGLIGTSAGYAILLVPGVIAIVVAVFRHSQMVLDDVAIELDGSRRWVTISGVADEFARAVESRDRRSLHDRS